MRTRLPLTLLALGLSASVGGTVLATTATQVPAAALGERTVVGPAHGAVGLRKATVDVRADTVYTGAFEERSSVSTGVSATLSWYDARGRELPDDRVSSAVVVDRQQAWTRYTVAGLVPAGAASVLLTATFDDAAGSALHTVRNLQLTGRPEGSTALAGPLTTRGTTVRDARGGVVVLRGLNRPGQWDAAQPGGLNEHDIARIKAWGANTVRLTLGQQVWLPGCSSYDPTYAAAVDRTVGWITRRGMLAVLDLQYGAPSCSSAGPNPLPDAGSLRFWTSVARRYRTQPLVAFDLWNEAYGVSAAAWRRGGATRSANGEGYRGVGMQQVYDAVRATGADNLVLVGGLDYAATPPGDERVRGTNVVWAVHAYACNVPWKCRATDAAALLSRFKAIGRRMPVMVSEFGYPASRGAQGAAFNADVIAYAEAMRWSWAAWAWDVRGTCRPEQYFNLLSSTSCGTGSSTFEPSPVGVPVLVGLGANTR